VRQPFTAADIDQAKPFFPLVGAVIGAMSAAVLALLDPLLPPLLVSLLLITATLSLTGAIHLDGLADMADGFGGGTSRHDTLRIMRDPTVGTFGATAIVLLVLTKAVAISALIDRHAAMSFLVIAPTLSRWTLAALPQWLPYARSEGGLGAAVSGTSGWWNLTVATIIAAIITGSVARTQAAPCWLGAIGVTAVIRHLCAHRLGGFTGDTLGANAEITETAVFLIAVVLTR
jgi:cobalamin 5'-phosphate synthase/cobalamin synthase